VVGLAGKRDLMRRFDGRDLMGKIEN